MSARQIAACNCTLIQTDEETKVCAVCFDPPKRVNYLQQAYQKKSPVTICGVKRTSSTSFSDKQEEFKILKQAKIMPTSTDFGYNSTIGSSLLTVKQAFSADLYKKIDVIAKVMSKNINKQVKVDCVIADETDIIKLALWEELIDKVECGRSYVFIRSYVFTIRVFDDTKYLSTKESTILEAKDDIEHVNLTWTTLLRETVLESR